MHLNILSAFPCPPTTSKHFLLLIGKVIQSFCDITAKSWSPLSLTPRKDPPLAYFWRFLVTFQLSVPLPVPVGSGIFWKAVCFCIACALFFSSPKRAVHSTLQAFSFFLSFFPLLRTEVETPGDSSTHLIGSVSLNQPVMELMAVCHPWRYKFPGGGSCRQCVKCALCASEGW